MVLVLDSYRICKGFVFGFLGDLLVTPVGPACGKPCGTLRAPRAWKPLKLASCAVSSSESSTSTKGGPFGVLGGPSGRLPVLGLAGSWLGPGEAGLLGAGLAGSWLGPGKAGLLGAGLPGLGLAGSWLGPGVAGLLGARLSATLGLEGGVPGSALKGKGV